VILADETEAGPARVGALEQRGGVDADLRVERPERVVQALEELLQAASHYQMVVFDLLGRRLRMVQLADADHGPRRGQEVARVGAQLAAPVGEIAHASGHAGGDPMAEAGELRQRLGAGDAGEIETTFGGQMRDHLTPIIARGPLMPLKPPYNPQ
jgi:hypothetical protein